jgi:hypothetical protein
MIIQAIPFLRWLTKFETKIIRKLMIFPHSPCLSNYVLGLWIMVCGEFRSFGISKKTVLYKSKQIILTRSKFEMRTYLLCLLTFISKENIYPLLSPGEPKWIFFMKSRLGSHLILGVIKSSKANKMLKEIKNKKSPRNQMLWGISKSKEQW